MTKPVVAHFVRGFLRPTETFIGNQISTLQKFDAKIYCHHKIFGHSFTGIYATSVLEKLTSFQQKIQQINYRLFRRLSLAGINALAREISIVKPVLLHFHYLVDARFFLPLAKKLGVPSIVSGYGWDVSSFPQMKFGYGKRYLQPIFREMDVFIAMSDDMKKDIIWLGCPEQKIVVHYYGTDVQRFKYPKRVYENKKIINILFCGRLVPKKAPQDILFALRLLEEHNVQLPQWHLTFVGDGPLRAELEMIVQKYHWKEKVTFRGHIPHESDELVKAYKQADIYIQPSRTVKYEKEGIPGTLVEAMASGLPVITTCHAGIPSIVQHEKQGLLIQEANIKELSNYILQLLTNLQLRKITGTAAAIRAISELELQERTAKLELLYDKILHSKHLSMKCLV